MLNRQLIFTFVLIFIAGFLVWLIIGDYPEKMEIKRQLGDLENKIEALEKEEERQKNMAEYLKSESYLEKQARLRLNLKKESEEVVFVYRKDNQNLGQDSENNKPKSLLSKLKEWIRVLIK